MRFLDSLFVERGLGGGAAAFLERDLDAVVRRREPGRTRWIQSRASSNQ